MLNLTVEQVNNLVSSSPRKNGRYNLFFKINDSIGLKLTKSREIRDGNYERQTKASQYGLGPDTHGTIDNVVFQNKVYFGYFTEIVEVFSDTHTPEQILNKEDMVNYEELYLALRKNLEFNFSDSHMGNIGRKNGKLVCIDFDNEWNSSLGCRRRNEYVVS